MGYRRKKTPPTQKTHPTDDYYYYYCYYYYYYYYYHYHTEAGTVAKNMTSPGRRKKHGLATEKRPGGGLRQPSQKTWVTVAKNTTDAENTPYRCKKHGRPSQKTCPPTRTVAKNTRHRCKKRLPQEPWQKTRKLASVAKNHELPTQKTRNPVARWLGAVLGRFFFGGRCSIFTLPFFRGRCSPSHTHIHINRTLANFFPDTIFASGGFYPKPIYETNVAFFWCFSF